MPLNEVIWTSLGWYALFDELHELNAYLVRLASCGTGEAESLFHGIRRHRSAMQWTPPWSKNSPPGHFQHGPIPPKACGAYRSHACTPVPTPDARPQRKYRDLTGAI